MIKTRQGHDQVRWCLESNSNKYHVKCDENYISLSIADSDLALPAEITNKIVERARFPYYGYQILTAEFEKAVLEHTRQKGFKEARIENLVFTPGTVFTATTVLQAYTKVGDKVMMTYPNYSPLYEMVKAWKREAVLVPMKMENGEIKLDLPLIEKEIIAQKPTMYILVSPTNPGGRVLTQDEMEQLLKICQKHRVFLLVDEIHGDVPLFENKIISFVKYIQDYDLIVCLSGNKTYNLAGIHNGWAVTRNLKQANKLHAILDAWHVSCSPNIFAQVAYAAAWNNGQKYLAESKKIYEENILYLRDYCQKNCPELRPIIPQATFLIYVDFAKTNISMDEMRKIITSKAKVLLQYADDYIDPQGHHFRINVATNPATIREAIERICQTVNQHLKKGKI